MQLLSVLAIGLFAGAALTDLARRRIPNGLVLALAGLGLIRVAASLSAGAGAAAAGADLAVALAVLAFGAGLFQLRLLGGGDVKLLAAGALWIGAPESGPFLTVTILAGGGLALVFLVWARLARGFIGRAPAAGLPYGVAIAAGGILTTLAAF